MEIQGEIELDLVICNSLGGGSHEFEFFQLSTLTGVKENLWYGWWEIPV